VAAAVLPGDRVAVVVDTNLVVAMAEVKAARADTVVARRVASRAAVAALRLAPPALQRLDLLPSVQCWTNDFAFTCDEKNGGCLLLDVWLELYHPLMVGTGGS
jgi:hypothetical protein